MLAASSNGDRSFREIERSGRRRGWEGGGRGRRSGGLELKGSGVVGTRDFGDEIGDLFRGGVEDLEDGRRAKCVNGQRTD